MDNINNLAARTGRTCPLVTLLEGRNVLVRRGLYFSSVGTSALNLACFGPRTDVRSTLQSSNGYCHCNVSLRLNTFRIIGYSCTQLFWSHVKQPLSRPGWYSVGIALLLASPESPSPWALSGIFSYRNHQPYSKLGSQSAVQHSLLISLWLFADIKQ